MCGSIKIFVAFLFVPYIDTYITTIYCHFRTLFLCERKIKSIIYRKRVRDGI